MSVCCCVTCVSVCVCVFASSWDFAGRPQILGNSLSAALRLLLVTNCGSALVVLLTYAGFSPTACVLVCVYVGVSSVFVCVGV